MVTPISLVAIATAISLTGLGSGAANMGIVAACVTFLFGSLRVNSIGVNLVLLIGAAKMMIPVYLKASHYRYSSNCEWHYLRNCGIRIKY